ncbi:MAG: hypothetical protein ACJ8FY_09170 [Gemmataceae bacterium]
MLLQPATFSYFFMALTMWFIWEIKWPSAKNLWTSIAPTLPLFVIFIVWANADRWFLLGLGTVALAWVGQGLDESIGAHKRQIGWYSSLLRRSLCYVLLAAVCLLAAHVSAFMMGLGNPDLTAWLASGSATSPFQKASFAQHGLTSAGLAYFPLLGLSLLSFLLNRANWSWQQFLPWLGLAVLSVFQVRTVPFFAIIAGPALARNLQDFLAHSLDKRPWQAAIWRRRVLSLQALTIVFVLILTVCAWPGWLQGAPYEPRRWAVEVQPSLEQGALATRRWLEETGLGPDARGLHLSAETASVFAWFCPEEKGLRDDRLASAIRGDFGGQDDWSKWMRSAGVNHVVLYDADRGNLFAALDNLLADSRQWPIMFMEGNLVVFGWRDPAHVDAVDPFQAWEPDFNRLAFRPDTDKKAPGESPEREPEVRPWWEAFWKRAPLRSIDQDKATLHLFHAEALRRSAPFEHKAAWEAVQSVAILGSSANWMSISSLLDARLRLTLLSPLQPVKGLNFASLSSVDQQAYALQQDFAFHRDDTPPALLYLAVRAARRAIAANPDDAQAYLVLGECYVRLLKSTKERIWVQRLPELLQLRRVQAAAAFYQAVSLKPGFAQAHLSLSRLYGEMGYLDLTLEHLGAYVKLTKEAGPPANVSLEQFRDQEAPFEEELNQLTKEVEKRENTHAVAAVDMKVLERAFRAWHNGLAGKARDMLLKSDIAGFGPRGMALELELLLKTGRPRPILEWIGPEQEQSLGAQPYHWLRVQALSASGDYTLAKEECNLLSPPMESIREIMALTICQRLLGERLTGRSLADVYLRASNEPDFRNRLARLAQTLKREADVTVLRGLLALEEGDIDEAEIAFRTALSYWKDLPSAASGSGLDFNARTVAQACLNWLE